MFMTDTTPPYDAYIDRIDPLIQNSEVVAILYYMSIAGRDRELQDEWSEGPLTMEQAKGNFIQVILEQDLVNQAIFGITFPQVSRVLAWQSARKGEWESGLQNIMTYVTADMSPKDEPYFVGCLLEFQIIDQEAILWSKARTVDEYFAMERDSALRAKLEAPN